jgi:mRNA interferase RelE/StbE
MFTIEVKRRALRRLEKLDEKRKRRLEEIIMVLKEDPVPFRKTDLCKLRGYENEYRIRVGDMRLVYTVSWTERKILIHYIGTREKAYI